MNEISLVYNFVIDGFDGDSLVNTVSIVPTLNMDMNKENIYPLVNIDLTETNIETDVVDLTFRITCVQQRDVKPKVTDNKLLSNTNYIDNLNETHSILQRFINYLLRQNNDLNIELTDYTRLRPLKDAPMSGVDGFQFDCTLQIENKGDACQL